MWRFDAQTFGRVAGAPCRRSSICTGRANTPPEVPAWPDQEKMLFDICYEPIVVGQTLYHELGSRHDCIRAIDVVTGDRKWIFFADGPIRFAPLACKGKLYFTSDDGYLYCLERRDGRARLEDSRRAERSPDSRQSSGSSRPGPAAAPR